MQYPEEAIAEEALSVAVDPGIERGAGGAFVPWPASTWSPAEKEADCRPVECCFQIELSKIQKVDTDRGGAHPSSWLHPAGSLSGRIRWSPRFMQDQGFQKHGPPGASTISAFPASPGMNRRKAMIPGGDGPIR
jgi:hypothetical protein